MESVMGLKFDPAIFLCQYVMRFEFDVQCIFCCGESMPSGVMAEKSNGKTDKLMIRGVDKSALWIISLDCLDYLWWSRFFWILC